MKKLVRDYRSMTATELQETARHARRQEETAPYAKGRRSWKSVWRAAEEELRRRQIETSEDYNVGWASAPECPLRR